MRLPDNSRRLGLCRRREIDSSFAPKFSAERSTPSSVNQLYGIFVSRSMQPSTSGRRVDGCVSRLQRCHTRGVADETASVVATHQSERVPERVVEDFKKCSDYSSLPRISRMKREGMESRFLPHFLRAAARVNVRWSWALVMPT